VIALSGPLGAGKTCLVQGIGHGLGVPDRITSPTFVLIHSHRGRLPFYHVDAYRLDGPDAAFEIGLPELFERGGVVAIEWAEHILDALPADRLEVDMAHEPGGRAIALRPGSEAWAGLLEELSARAGPGD
jgi:tRNA threonylcarbamoyladenosine biosynthesis protein TsaE